MNLLSSLQEVLKKVEYDQLLPKMQFGIELEVVHKDYSKYREIVKLSFGLNEPSAAIRKIFQTIHENDDSAKQQLKSGLTHLGHDDVYDKFESFLKLLQSFGSIHVGSYHSSQDFSRWRVEDDPTVHLEVISPKLSYEDLLRQIPTVVKRLRSLGFSGTKSTGFHINISDEAGLLSADRTREKILDQVSKYGFFSVFAFIEMQELQGLFKQGAQARESQTHSQTFFDALTGMFSWKKSLYKSIALDIAEQLTGVSGKKYTVIIPVDFYDSDYKLGVELNSDTRFYFNSTTGGSNDVASSHKIGRVESRALGGSVGFNSLAPSNGVGQVVRLAVATYRPFLFPSFEEPKVKKASQRFFIKLVSPYLEELFMNSRRYRKAASASDKAPNRAPLKWTGSNSIAGSFVQNYPVAFQKNTPLGFEFGNVPSVKVLIKGKA